MQHNGLSYHSRFVFPERHSVREPLDKKPSFEIEVAFSLRTAQRYGIQLPRAR